MARLLWPNDFIKKLPVELNTNPETIKAWRYGRRRAPQWALERLRELLKRRAEAAEIDAALHQADKKQ